VAVNVFDAEPALRRHTTLTAPWPSGATKHALRPKPVSMRDEDALLTLRLPARPEAVSAARKALASLNGDLHLVSHGRLRDAQLLVSELVTNGMRHSRHDEVSLTVRADSAVLRVEVANTGTPFEQDALRTPSYDRAGGWGLRIVELLAHRWGIDSRGEEVQVWFEIDRPDSDAPLPIIGEAPPPPGQ
jgi:anti-sigma regulatory factor (Ser/Thr protein kinase)